MTRAFSNATPRKSSNFAKKIAAVWMNCKSRTFYVHAATPQAALKGGRPLVLSTARLFRSPVSPDPRGRPKGGIRRPKNSLAKFRELA